MNGDLGRPFTRRARALVAGSFLATFVAAQAAPVRPFPSRAIGWFGSGPAMQTAPSGDVHTARGVDTPEGTLLTPIRTVDSASWTGYENAVYAADRSTVFVAYKRFLQDPRQQEYTPAELRVARSTNGGR